MYKETEFKIGINVGKTSREDRGITKYTLSILSEFNNLASDDTRFVLLHYPNSKPENNLGLKNSQSVSLPYSDRHSSIITIINEQLINPLHQKALNLDVVWHPHNKCQIFTPTGYVSTIHDVLPIAEPRLSGNYLNKRGKMMLYQSRTLTASRADIVITASEFSRSEIIKHLNIDPNKVVKVYSGIDKNIFKPTHKTQEKIRIKNQYSLPEKYLLSTGSYAPHKNLKTLVDAYNQSCLPNKNIGLVIVGPNDASGYKLGHYELKEYVDKLGLTSKIRLLSSVPLKDLVLIYGSAHMFATTSLYEGFGFTPLEAMACGIPVIASNTTSIPEVCGNAALYADPRDPTTFTEQLNFLINNYEASRALISRGINQVSKFDWQTTARKTLEILKSVAQSRR